MHVATHVNGWIPVCVLPEIHQSKLPFVSLVEFIRSKLSFLDVHVGGSVCEVWTHQYCQGFNRRPSIASYRLAHR